VRKPPTILRNHVPMMLLEVSLSSLQFSLMVSEGEVKSPYFLQVWWALIIHDCSLSWLGTGFCHKLETLGNMLFHRKMLADLPSWIKGHFSFWAKDVKVIIFLNICKIGTNRLKLKLREKLEIYVKLLIAM
jgi:hypothetical protein